MATAAYRPLKQEVDGFHDGQQNKSDNHNSTSYRMTFMLLVLLAISTALNIFLLYSPAWYHKQDAESYKSRYARLPWNKEVTLGHDNRSLDDPFWTDERHNPYMAMVALDEKFVKDHELLPAQRYPWAPEKSLYVSDYGQDVIPLNEILTGLHSMHCLRVLRETVLEARDGLKMSNPFDHITHCFHTLREEIECNADDFPRYTGRLNTQVNEERTSPGDGSVRVCRDWDQLLQFSVENTACWNQTPSLYGQPLIEDFKYCPDGSKPWEKILE